jgi:hypothetical protein
MPVRRSSHGTESSVIAWSRLYERSILNFRYTTGIGRRTLVPATTERAVRLTYLPLSSWVARRAMLAPATELRIFRGRRSYAHMARRQPGGAPNSI